MKPTTNKHNQQDGKKTEDVILKEINAKFSSIFEEAPIGISCFSTTGKLLLVNNSFCEMLGYTKEEMTQFDFQSITHKDDVHSNIHLRMQVLTGKQKTISVEKKYIHKNKNIVWAYITTSLIKNDSGDPLCFISYIQNITEQKKNKIAINDSEEKYKILIEQAVDGIFLFDTKGIIIDANSKGCFMSGYTKEELLKINIETFFSKEEREKTPLRHDLLKKGETVISERILTRKDKSTLFIEMYTKMMPDQTFQSFFRDISQRKKNETELRASEILYRTIFETTGTATVIVDENTIITKANTETEKLTGYKKEELEGKKSWKEFIAGEDLERMIEMNAKRRKGDPEVLKSYDFRFKNREGILKNIHLTIDLIPETKNSIASLLDITEWTQRERELRDSELRYRSLVESFHDMVFLTDYSHRMVYANPSLERHTGYILQDFINDTENILFIHPDDDAQVMKNIREFIGSNENFSKPYENRFIDKWKRMRWHSTVISKVIFKGNPALQFICHDITNRKEYENQLMQAKYKAEESDKLKSAFLANMSHEIRTPMNAILGFSSLLSDDSINNDQKDEFIGIIQNSGQQLLALINDIIDISKIEAGQMRISKTLCGLNQIINELYISFNSDLAIKNKKEIELKILIDKYCEGLIFMTDEVRLKQVLSNLISNAIKFTHKGKIEINCKQKDNNYILFYISDTGIGVPEDMHKLIFEPFRQVENSQSNQYGGTGLGLSISKNLVELMGGEMWIESGIKTGSVFYFTLPLIRDIEKTSSNKKITEVDANYNWKDKTILITEDESSNFKYLQELFRKTEAKIIWAESGEQAIEICKNNSAINLVLIDIRMPGMSGIDATRIIRKIRPDLPVVAQTAYAYTEDKEKCFNAGCVGYLTKPIRSEKLFDVLSNIFRKE